MLFHYIILLSRSASASCSSASLISFPLFCSGIFFALDASLSSSFIMTSFLSLFAFVTDLFYAVSFFCFAASPPSASWFLDCRLLLYRVSCCAPSWTMLTPSRPSMLRALGSLIFIGVVLLSFWGYKFECWDRKLLLLTPSGSSTNALWSCWRLFGSELICDRVRKFLRFNCESFCRLVSVYCVSAIGLEMIMSFEESMSFLKAFDNFASFR